MSTPHDPYQPPSATSYYQPPPLAWQEPAWKGPWPMNYTGGFEMIHRMPEWFLNILTAGVCALIPLIGGIVLWGYSFEATEALHRTSGAYCPRFDFNRFVEYLVRGVAVFLVQLLFGVLQAGLIFGSYILLFVAAIGAGAAADQGQEAAAGIAVAVAVLIVILAVFAITVLTYFVQTPLAIRGGLSGDIGQAFQFSWAMDFIKRTWLEMLLVMLFQIALSVPLMMFVLATCYLGLVPGIGYMILVIAWLNFQLYRVYLSRGGAPVPLKLAPLPAQMQ